MTKLYMPTSVTNLPVPVGNGISTSEWQTCKDNAPVTVSSPKPTPIVCYSVNARSGDQLEVYSINNLQVHTFELYHAISNIIFLDAMMYLERHFQVTAIELYLIKVKRV